MSIQSGHQAGILNCVYITLQLAVFKNINLYQRNLKPAHLQFTSPETVLSLHQFETVHKIAIMGWNQWGLLRFANKSYQHSLKLKFPDTNKHWGWPFEANGNINTRNRIEYSDIEKTEILPNTTYAYGQTGKQNEWAGMEGTVDVHVKSEPSGLGEKVCKMFYSCPWSGKNQCDISEIKPGWNVQQWGADFNGDALGSVTVEIRKA
ncbi:hypothetical protein MMC28_001928 [Mycoblastus sanguinarius]|nr:hypothetical protein [Mycoblastus sanguinarius]